MGRWKSPRVVKHLESNSDALVRKATSIALSVETEELRIGALTILRGVGWPMASVILQFCHEDPYPILDFRALWSLSVDVPSVYTFPFWWAYTQHCRKLAEQAGVDMRTLDRALWQYSKENQPSPT